MIINRAKKGNDKMPNPTQKESSSPYDRQRVKPYRDDEDDDDDNDDDDDDDDDKEQCHKTNWPQSINKSPRQGQKGGLLWPWPPSSTALGDSTAEARRPPLLQGGEAGGRKGLTSASLKRPGSAAELR